MRSTGPHQPSTYSSEGLLSSQGPRFPAKFVILQHAEWVDEVTDVVSCIGWSAWADKLAIALTCLNEVRGENGGEC